MSPVTRSRSVQLAAMPTTVRPEAGSSSPEIPLVATPTPAVSSGRPSRAVSSARHSRGARSNAPSGSVLSSSRAGPAFVFPPTLSSQRSASTRPSIAFSPSMHSSDPARNGRGSRLAELGVVRVHKHNDVEQFRFGHGRLFERRAAELVRHAVEKRERELGFLREENERLKHFWFIQMENQKDRWLEGVRDERFDKKKSDVELQLLEIVRQGVVLETDIWGDRQARIRQHYNLGEWRLAEEMKTTTLKLWEAQAELQLLAEQQAAADFGAAREAYLAHENFVAARENRSLFGRVVDYFTIG